MVVVVEEESEMAVAVVAPPRLDPLTRLKED